MPPPSDRRRTPVEYVVPDGMRPTAAVEERGRCIGFGRGVPSAARWRYTANLIATMCASGLTWTVWRRSPGAGAGFT